MHNLTLDTKFIKLDDEKMKFSKKDIQNFKKKLIEMELQQKDLAEKIEVNENTIVNAFAGEHISLATIKKISDFFGFEVSETVSIFKKK